LTKLLWTPSDERVKASNMYRFISFINKRYIQEFNEYEELYKWSVDNIPDFWVAVWEFVGIKASCNYDQVIDDLNKMPGAKWFPGARLNFAENLLKHRDKHVALVFKSENRESVNLTYEQLYNEVNSVAKSLRELGIKTGDCIAGFMPNMPETVVGMLAAASIGAIWSSCSPDFGTKGVLDRFGQIKPKVLFTANGYYFKGKKFDSLKTVSVILKEIKSIEKVVVVPYTEDDSDISNIPIAQFYDDFRASQLDETIQFEQLPFDHPLYIMYSSGTTGLPKCLVQSGGGILINHLKELVLHTNLKREDNIFYFTTCGWMMWNWLVSSLGVGATVVLFDGNPFYPDPGALWKMTEDEAITVFGTSAGYINALQNSGVKPAKEYDLSSLKTILSTGSPLSAEAFEFVYKDIKEDVQLSSISGGTDLNGCFFLGNPTGPVYAGELQCRGLGLKVEAFNEKGKSIINQQGELVCTAPFPSMPIYFREDEDNQKYHKAYFDKYPDVWRHGDYIELNDRGGAVIFGRSDATLNPGGVRIGTAEIYTQVGLLEEIDDSLVIGQTWKKDVRVVLFVKMAEGFELTDEIKKKIKQTIRTNMSPRHVPAKIVAVPEIPYTLNMKKVEIAVKKTVQNEPVLNRDSLRNPKALDFYKNLKELKED